MQENLKVEDIRKTDMTTVTNLVTGEIKVVEEHADSRQVTLYKGEGLPELWRSNHGDHEFQPAKLVIKWRRGSKGEFDRFGTDVDMFGWRLKKNGEPGEREARAWWMPWYENGREKTPDWVLALHDEWHPEMGPHPFTYAVTKKPDDEIDPNLL